MIIIATSWLEVAFLLLMAQVYIIEMTNVLLGAFVGAHKWHCFLCSNDWDIYTSWCGFKRYSYPREIFARLFHKHIEEIERSQSTVKASWHLLLNEDHFVIRNVPMNVSTSIIPDNTHQRGMIFIWIPYLPLFSFLTSIFSASPHRKGE